MDRMTADDLKNEASETISSAASEARRKMSGLVDWGKDQAARLKDPAANVWNSSMDYVKANPGKTIIVSLAVGVVIGSLLSRRRGD
jgi:ElaB/YqjD/DUF883 family membrane-anchored ribosome-binding protein